MNVHVLQADDTADFRVVRLRGLKEHPEAFGASYDEECEMPVENYTQWLTGENNWVFGAFDPESLVGVVSLNRVTRVKTQHRAMLGAMYVVPEARGRGVGEALLGAALDQARKIVGLEDVVLAVTVGNEAARHLYIKAGFVPYSIDPRYIRVDDRYFDIEWMILKVG